MSVLIFLWDQENESCLYHNPLTARWQGKTQIWLCSLGGRGIFSLPCQSQLVTCMPSSDTAWVGVVWKLAGGWEPSRGQTVSNETWSKNKETTKKRTWSNETETTLWIIITLMVWNTSSVTKLSSYAVHSVFSYLGLAGGIRWFWLGAQTQTCWWHLFSAGDSRSEGRENKNDVRSLSSQEEIVALSL